MANDHFVAQTYLKRFAQPRGTQLHGYSKSKLTEFPCWPKDVCREWDGDLVPEFLSNPAGLGEFRKLFEPHWNTALDCLLEDCDAGGQVKLAIAGYAANLLGSTPAMRRVTVESHNHHVVETLRSRQALLAKRGAGDPVVATGIDMIDAGEVVVATEPNWARAMNTKHMMKFAWRILNSDWVVVKNLTDCDFVTSDNPFAFEDPGPFRGGPAVLPRYLPLTPRFCLYVVMTNEDFGPIELEKPPKGGVRFATLDNRDRVDHINKLVIQCAEELVITSAPRAEIPPLVAEYSGYRISNEYFTIAQADGFLQGLRMRVWDPAAQPRTWNWPPS